MEGERSPLLACLKDKRMAVSLTFLFTCLARKEEEEKKEPSSFLISLLGCYSSSSFGFVQQQHRQQQYTPELYTLDPLRPDAFSHPAPRTSFSPLCT